MLFDDMSAELKLAGGPEELLERLMVLARNGESLPYSLVVTKNSSLGTIVF